MADKIVKNLKSILSYLHIENKQLFRKRITFRSDSELKPNHKLIIYFIRRILKFRFLIIKNYKMPDISKVLKNLESQGETTMFVYI